MGAFGTPEERFWPKVDLSHPRGCWLWLGKPNPNGYGVHFVGPRQGQRKMAHVFAWEVWNQKRVPPGLCLDHFRMNPGPRNAPCSKLCVNPRHTEPVTRGENVLRGRSVGAQNARKTHCPAGHAYNATNTRTRENGKRGCRTCEDAYGVTYGPAYRAAHRLEASAHTRAYYATHRDEILATLRSPEKRAAANERRRLARRAAGVPERKAA